MPGEPIAALSPERGISRAVSLLREANEALLVATPESVWRAADCLRTAINAVSPAFESAPETPGRFRARALVLARRLAKVKSKLRPALEFWYQQHLQGFGGAAYGPAAGGAPQPTRCWDG